MKRTLVAVAALAFAACTQANPHTRLADAKAAFAAEDYVHARATVLAAHWRSTLPIPTCCIWQAWSA